MAPEWHPDPNEFDLVGAAPKRQRRSRMAPNGTYSWRLDCHISPIAAPLPALYFGTKPSGRRESNSRSQLGKKRAVGRTTMDQSEPSEQVRTSATRRRTLMNGGVRGIFAGCDIPAKSAIRAVSSGRGGAFTSYKHRHLLRTRLDHLRSDARGGRAPSDGHEMSRLKVNLVPAAANANP